MAGGVIGSYFCIEIKDSRSFAVQGVSGGVLAGVARQNTPINPPAA